MVSIHTLELTKEFDKDSFQKWRSKAKYKNCFNDEKDYSSVKKGITVWYHQTEFKRKIL